MHICGIICEYNPFTGGTKSSCGRSGRRWGRMLPLCA